VQFTTSGLVGRHGQTRRSPDPQAAAGEAIKNIERGATDARGSTLAAIQHALDKAGVAFLEAGDTRDGGLGVRLKKK
jgi:hypothetical protein